MYDYAGCAQPPVDVLSRLRGSKLETKDCAFVKYLLTCCRLSIGTETHDYVGYTQTPGLQFFGFLNKYQKISTRNLHKKDSYGKFQWKISK